MINKLLILLLLTSCLACTTNKNTAVKKSFNSVKIDTLFKDKISIRAIEIDGNTVWYAADKGRFGSFDLNKNERKEQFIDNGTAPLEFRSIAQNKKSVFIVNVGNPAFLYQIPKNSRVPKVVYQESNEKVFFDSMRFWDTNEGIAMGDPVADCLNIIITRDGGATWSRIATTILPTVKQGEAAFAASNTNIIVKGNDTWIVSGGVQSRVFYSGDRGRSWTVYNTPIVQGRAMTGIFTADFYNSKIGFISGGDYENRNQNFGNKAITIDGGKTWKLVAENQGFGYASCVQFVPGGGGKELVSVGFSGLYYSADSGQSWKLLFSDSSLNTIRFINRTTAIAAGQQKMIRIQFK